MIFTLDITKNVFCVIIDVHRPILSKTNTFLNVQGVNGVFGSLFRELFMDHLR